MQLLVITLIAICVACDACSNTNHMNGNHGSCSKSESKSEYGNIYFLNGGLRKVVVTFFQWVKFIFLTTHERTFQPSLRGVEN
jgi:hypothetical protein